MSPDEAGPARPDPDGTRPAPATGDSLPGETLPGGAFRAEVPIRFSHCDPAGIVYFPNYFDLFNGVVEDWFTRRLGVDYADMLGRRRQGLPAVHAECDFRRPSRMGDRLTLGLLLDRIGTSSLHLTLPGFGPEGLRLRGRLVLAVTSFETHRAVPIPPELRARLARYRAECGAADDGATDSSG